MDPQTTKGITLVVTTQTIEEIFITSFNGILIEFLVIVRAAAFFILRMSVRTHRLHSESPDKLIFLKGTYPIVRYQSKQ